MKFQVKAKDVVVDIQKQVGRIDFKCFHLSNVVMFDNNNNGTFLMLARILLLKAHPYSPHTIYSLTSKLN